MSRLLAGADHAMRGVLAPIGFLQRGHAWNRRSGPFVDVIDLQLTKAADRFWVNLGVVEPDAHARTWGQPVPSFVSLVSQCPPMSLLSPPAVPPGPGTVVVIAPPDPEPQVFVYIAVCDAVQHPKETPGNVDPNGFWNSGFFENCADAFAAAEAHADGSARVDAVTGGVGVSIIGCS